MELFIQSAESNASSALMVNQELNLRFFTGETLASLLHDTKVYTFLQTRNIESAIRIFWNGKGSYDGAFMDQSTAYQTLFVNELGERLDTEVLGRKNALSFTRKRGDPHNFCYHGLVSRMKLVLQTELLTYVVTFLVY